MASTSVPERLLRPNRRNNKAFPPSTLTMEQLHARKMGKTLTPIDRSISHGDIWTSQRIDMPPHPRFHNHFGGSIEDIKPPQNQRQDSHAALGGGTPLVTNEAIYDDFVKKASELGLLAFCQRFSGGSPLRIVTMCSGTESPVLALSQMQGALARDRVNGQDRPMFKFEHVASAEIEPFKQAYIERNFKVPTLFHDVTEFLTHELPRTAYGGEAEWPMNIHILVAGSACVDYSTLNAKRREFGEKGESFSTMSGIKAYAERCRPNLIILENVETAPWTKIVQYWKEIGYTADWMKVDTKDYYMPQTRARGYMIAFDQKHADAINFDVTNALGRWKTNMTNFKQRATAPFTDFIYANDDPYIQSFRDETEQSADQNIERRPVDWAACRVRYQHKREEDLLGTKRPQTLWQHNGSCQPRDHGWVKWGIAQRERIWDTFDIHALYCFHKRLYDVNYKHRYLDLSQNIDRDSDNREWGIVGCITPGGMPYLTTRGGPMSGRESLALQGLPLEDLFLPKETSRQLQDLAGNAMTTPVICAALLSALGAGKSPQMEGSSFADWDVPPNTSRNTQELLALANQDIVAQKSVWPLQDEPPRLGITKEHNLATLLTLAGKTYQLCACEGYSGLISDRLQVCTECGHTACASCAGNPSHQYHDLPPEVLTNRKSPAAFVSAVTDALPRAIQLQLVPFQKFAVPSQSTRFGHKFGEKAAKDFQTAVKQATRSVVYFRQVKRANSWRVIYDSKHARLELRFTKKIPTQLGKPGSHTEKASITCHWLLFAKPDDSEPRLSDLRQVLKDPIAQMQPQKSLLEGRWDLRDQNSSVNLKVVGTGGLLPAWEAELGLQDHCIASRKRYMILDISPVGRQTRGSYPAIDKVCGTYELLPKCGTASGTLHRRFDNSGEPVFFFLDPQSLGTSEFDQMTFAHEARRHCDDDTRMRIVDVEPEWVPRQHAPQHVKCTVVEAWKPMPGKIVEHQISIDRWTPSALTSVTIKPHTCHETRSTVLLIKLPVDARVASQWVPGMQTSLHIGDRPAELKDLAWLLKPAGKLNGLDNWQTAHLAEQAYKRCSTCAPALPELQWKLQRRRRAARVDVMPIENVEDATRYEQALKARPVPIAGIIHRHDHDTSMQITLNLTPLVHEVMARLQSRNTASNVPATVRWRIADQDTVVKAVDLSQTTLLSNCDDMPWSSQLVKDGRLCTLTKPAHFLRDLWPNQSKTLTWMMARENAGSQWLETEREEVSIASVGWRLDVYAQRSVLLRGGVLADEIGAGKTTTSCALITASSAEAHQTGYTAGEKTIRSKATLVLVPKNLLEQWDEESYDCVGEGLKFVRIDSVQQLHDTELEHIVDADLVLAPWDLLGDDKYWDTLKWLCHSKYVPERAGRGFEHWLNDALDDLGELVCASSGCNTDQVFSAWDSTRDANQQKYKKYRAFSKTQAERDNTLVGGLGQPVFFANLVNEAKDKDDDDNDEDDDDDDGSPAVTRPKKLVLPPSWIKERSLPTMLHMFTFKRLIVDEFTYLSGRCLMSMPTLHAERRWLLSGTPPVKDFDSINTLARLIGTKIASDCDESRALSFNTDKASIVDERTNAEKFRADLLSRSANYLNLQNAEASQWVRQFVRQNSVPTPNVPCINHFHLMRPSYPEMFWYHRVYRFIMSESIKFGVEVKKEDLWSKDLELAVQTYARSCESREQALILAPSHVQRVPYMRLPIGLLPIMLTQRNIMRREQKQMSTALKHFSLAAREAMQWIADSKWPEESRFLHSFFTRILSNDIGDPAVARMLNFALGAAEKNPKPLTWLYSGQKQGQQELDTAWVAATLMTPQEKLSYIGARQNESQLRAGVMLSYAEELVKEMRIYRFYLAALQCIDPKDKPFNSCVGCGHHKGIRKSYILDSCGHVLCQRCEEDFRDEQCPHRGCEGLAMTHNLVVAESLSRTKAQEPEFYSSKADKVLCLIWEIMIKSHKEGRDGLDGDRIIIFVQYDLLRDHVQELLESKGVPFLDGSQPWGITTAQYKIDAFSKATDRRVLFLPLNSPDAAGWNLQIANHIIFLAPLIVKTQHEYDSIMKQAIGRALRPGQKKPVHVHYFLHNHMYDVNVIQDRHKKWLVRDKHGIFSLKDQHDMVEGDARGFDAWGLNGMQDWTQKTDTELQDETEDAAVAYLSAHPDEYEPYVDSGSEAE